MAVWLLRRGTSYRCGIWSDYINIFWYKKNGNFSWKSSIFMSSFNFILIEITFAGRNEPQHWLICVKEKEPRICCKGTVIKCRQIKLVWEKILSFFIRCMAWLIQEQGLHCILDRKSWETSTWCIHTIKIPFVPVRCQHTSSIQEIWPHKCAVQVLEVLKEASLTFCGWCFECRDFAS